MARAFLVLVGLVLCCGVLAAQKTLVVVDDLSVESSHSLFFKSLRGERDPSCSRLGDAFADFFCACRSRL